MSPKIKFAVRTAKLYYFASKRSCNFLCLHTRPYMVRSSYSTSYLSCIIIIDFCCHTKIANKILETKAKLYILSRIGKVFCKACNTLYETITGATFVCSNAITFEFTRAFKKRKLMSFLLFHKDFYMISC